MANLAWFGALAIALAPETAADAVTLRDGRAVLGQVVEPPTRGKVTLVVRRAWVEANLPDRAKTWQATEARAVERARKARLDRLETWRLDRRADRAAGPDPISAWIDAEVDRLRAGDDAGKAPLMVVALDRADVRSVATRPEAARRALRQAWRAGFDAAETTTLADLARRLEGRGFALGAIDRAPLDDLLPPQAEPEARWLARRAATEVAHEPALRLVAHRGLVFPEADEGSAAMLANASADLIRSLAGGTAEDRLGPKLRQVAARGRVGVVLTRLDVADDLSSVRVESSLLVRVGPDRWAPAVARTARGRPDATRPGEARGLEADPRVAGAFQVADALGLGDLSGVKATALGVGAATRHALGEARSALQADLDALAFPIAEPRRPPKDRPTELRPTP